MPSLPVVHAFCDDALAELDATALATAIRDGELSALEVTEAAIARAERVNPTINAIQFTGYEMARNAARKVKPGSATFAGVPTFAKDNLNIRGLPTNAGTSAFTAVPMNVEDPFASQYLAQGLICLGKSRLPEFGFNATTEFQDRQPARNPWNPAHSTGASSGGAAALVAAGVVPIAHANDGGGSIRIPAACCGLVGLKPSRGRLPSPEASARLPIDLAVEGVVTRSVRDTANFYAEAARHYTAKNMAAIGHVTGPATRRLKIGVVYDSIIGESCDTDTQTAVALNARLLEQLGHQISEFRMPVPTSFVNDFSAYWGFLAFMVSKLGRVIFDPEFDASKLDNLSKGLGRLYQRQMLKTPWIINRLRNIPRVYAEIFRDYDVVLSPVLGHATPELGHLSPAQDFETLYDRLMRYVCFTPFNNIAGGPAIALPLGQSATGLPLGLHFSAAHGNEKTLLELAFELEAARPWRRIQDF